VLGVLIGKWGDVGHKTHKSAGGHRLISLAGFRTFRRQLSFGGVVAEVLFVALVLVATFTYLDVPLGNALLIGVTLTLQAALGTVVLMRILSGVKGSLLLLMGPGVIVGGALSFGLFQIVGRGWLGLVATTAAGLVAMSRLVRSTPWQPLESKRLWLISQILGLAALALTWEFGELLPVAIACFVFGFFTSDSPHFPSTVRWLVGIAASGVIIAAFFLRQDYWWLVTDDYQFFEVMSRHITESGVLANWGVSNWAKYHWLSYGWSGLLNFSGGNPEGFVTLTRVMPALYSLALGASLMLISASFVFAAKVQFLTMLPAWTIVALHRLDWSGTSTSGVYTVIAAVTAAVVLELSTTNSFGRRVAIYGIGLPIIALTKLPSLFAVFIAFTLIEVWNSSRRTSQVKRLLLLVPAPFAVTALVTAAISVTGSVIGGWNLVSVNPNLGQLSEFGPSFAATGLLLQKLWIWVPVLVGVLWAMQRSLQPPKNIIRGLAYFAIPLLFMALVLDIKIFGNANTAEYFSGPMYFLGSFVLLPLVPRPIVLRIKTQLRAAALVCSVALFAAGYFWARLELAVEMWDFIGVQTFQWNGLKVVLLQWVSADGRFALALVLLVSILIGFWNTNWRRTCLISALFVLPAYTLSGFVEFSGSELTRERSIEELAGNIGSNEIQDVGVWLKNNTNPASLIATNYIVGSNGGELSDYSLAVWSDRPFLVLGPRFVGQSPAKERAVALALRFANNPTKDVCRSLSKQGVQWFVIDLRLTGTRSWETCTTTAYESKNFLVLRLTP
jgi:hypothetical protein